ncbi:MAG: T9SS type A sorting domain-containing protein [Bacteroidales bacterium]|nr:T9SS type A sorting domain-containing protein [Bacteroidales bacterium]
MKKLLKGVLSLAIAAAVGTPQMQAANDYRIEVKNYTYSKQTRDGLYGVTYTEDDNTYTDRYWPLVEGYLPYYQSNGSYNIARHQMVRQFGVSMGVVYWINPAENYIYWWNTVTGENGKTRPTKSYGVGYADGINNPNFDFEFLGAETGSGAMSHDWYGNLVHMWNDGLNGWGTTAGTHFVQGYAVYKSPTEYGQLMDFIPKLSKMNDTGRANYPFYQRQVTGSTSGVGTLGGTQGVYDLNYYNYYPSTSNTPNPNYPANKITWGNNWHRHKADTSIPKQPTDFMGVSGNLWGKGVLQGATQSENFGKSEYTCGWSTGQVFHARNDIAFGNMFADGQYTNWYLNYRLTATNPTVNTIAPNGYWAQAYDDAGNALANKYVPVAAAFTNYPTEYLFRETDMLEYFWSVPQGGLTEYDINDRGGYKWNGYVYGLYTNAVDFYSYCTWTQSRPSDAMSAPEVDSIKGTRVMIHNLWLQFTPGEDTGNESKRNGSYMIRSAKYADSYGNNPMSTTSDPVFTGNPTHTYGFHGYGYGYNKTPNDPETFINTGVNCWSELERVNDNVLALYTHVPGQGFSKSFITAVKPNNAVSSLKVAQSWNADGEPVHTLTWTPQAYDRATMHTYEVWYRKKKGSTYEDTKTIDGASRNVWMLAGKAHVKYNGATDSTTTSSGNKSGVKPNKTFYNSYTAESCKFEFVAPRGNNGDGTKYERTYEYMVIPVYDRSAHRGTEATTSIVTAPAPSKIYGNLYQVTDKNANGETLYGFSIRLDPYFLPGALGSTEAKRLIITSAGGLEGSNKLKDAVSVTLADGTPLTPQEGITFQSTSSGGTTTHGAYALSIDIAGKVGADGKLPSIIWHNVNPTLEFQLAAHIESTSDVQYSGTGNLSTTLYVPVPTLSLPDATIQKIGTKCASFATDEDFPIGTFRKKGSTEATDPVSMENANYVGTMGGKMSPLFVTDEVMGTPNAENTKYENTEWEIAYSFHLENPDSSFYYKQDLYGQIGTGFQYYSNENTINVDYGCLPVGYDLVSAGDGRYRKVYNAAKTPKNYKAYVTVAYRRGELEVIDTSAIEEFVVNLANPFPGLNNVQSTSALFYQGETHYDATFSGYYKHYYNAAIQWQWGYTDDLNKYIGYHATSKFNCVGHDEMVTDESGSYMAWVPYYPGSVLTDAQVSTLNTRYKGELLRGLYGEDEGDWSTLASSKNTMPMNVHYVYASTEPLTQSNFSQATMDIELTTEYPLIVSKDAIPEAKSADSAKYRVGNLYINESHEAYSYNTMDVITVATPYIGYQANNFVTTGIEGILVDALGGVKIYPNPVDGEFKLQAPMTISNVKIFSVDGQLVKEVNPEADTTVTINVEDLPEGLYIVNTLGMSKIMIKK